MDQRPENKNDFMPRQNEEVSCLISRQTSQFSDAETPSLVLSQTNNDRTTLTSMMYTQEKQFTNQPSTSRKHYNRSNFAQTSEKKGIPQHSHLPQAIFTASQSNALQKDGAIGRQQSVSSFNNTSIRDHTSCNSRQSYFVNALGQRVSSEVLLFNKHFDPADASLQQLFNRNTSQSNSGSAGFQHQLTKQRVHMSQIAPVEEFGRETMSSIPDEA